MGRPTTAADNAWLRSLATDLCRAATAIDPVKSVVTSPQYRRVQ